MARRTIVGTYVAKADIGPVVEIVAIGTLAGVVIVTIRCYVARFTIDEPTVVKVDAGPVLDIVTVGALTIVVICRCVSGMARLAIDEATVVKVHVAPVVIVVTVGTLTLMVRGRRWFVAGLAITAAAVVLDIAPVASAVADDTLALIMLRWCTCTVARSAIHRILVSEGYFSPGVNIVTGGALTGIVARR